jgi:hypothetical protein
MQAHWQKMRLLTTFIGPDVGEVFLDFRKSSFLDLSRFLQELPNYVIQNNINHTVGKEYLKETDKTGKVRRHAGVQ